MGELVRCQSLSDVVAVLGGARNTASIVGCTIAAVHNWGSAKTGSGLIPARHYAVIATELDERGFYAPWCLFHFTRIDRDAA